MTIELICRVVGWSAAMWLILLAIRSCSGALRSVVAIGGLIGCLLIPLAAPWLTRKVAAPPVLTDSPVVTSPLPSASVAPPTTPSPAVSPSAAEIPWDQFALGAWIGIGIVLVLRLGAGLWSAHGIARRAAPSLVLGTPVRITDRDISPMTVLPRTIVIPAAIADWPEAQLRPILDHERAHARRGDAATMVASSLIVALTWPIPFVWLLRRELIRAIEDAADDHVLAQEIDPIQYAETLRRACQELRAAPAAPTFVRKSMIASRITRTLRPNVNRRAIRPAAALTLVAFSALFATAAASGLLVEESNSPAEEKTGSKPSPVRAEVFQLQTMGEKPTYWKPDGTVIPADKAITRAHNIAPKPGDVVVWLRVKTDRNDAILTMNSVSVKGHTFSPNGGAGFYENGYFYTANRIYTDGRSLPARGTVAMTYTVEKPKVHPPYLSQDQIAKGLGREEPLKLSDPYESVQWKTEQKDGKEWTVVTVTLKPNSFSFFGFRAKVEGEKNWKSTFQFNHKPKGGGMIIVHRVDVPPSRITSLSAESRGRAQTWMPDVALRPKSR